MPRIEQPHTSEALSARVALENYARANGLTTNALAKAAGVGQPVLQRFMQGQTKTVTPIIQTVLDYAKIKNVMHAKEVDRDVCDDDRIRRALHRVWDGRDESIKLLASLIEALEPVMRVGTHRHIARRRAE